VYADALREVGDPLADRLSLPPDASAQRLSSDLREALTRGCTVDWSHGMMRRARLATSTALMAFLGSRLATFVVELTVAIPRTRHEPDPALFVDAVKATRLPALRRLTLGHLPPGLIISMPGSPRLTDVRVYPSAPP
jgi:hypothetical protein